MEGDMSLSDCPECWETPCLCGHQYKSWTVEKLREFIAMLQTVLAEKGGGLHDDSDPGWQLMLDKINEGLAREKDLRERNDALSSQVGALREKLRRPARTVKIDGAVYIRRDEAEKHCARCEARDYDSPGMAFSGGD